jgi:hypothetical protein
MTEVCVIDSSGQFVTVADRDSYDLREGEQFVETAPPVFRPAAGYPGFVKPIWNGEKWTESATFHEMLRWEFAHMNTTTEGKTIWETLEDSYREGVNSAYDQ